MHTDDFVEFGNVLVVEQFEDEHLAHEAALGVLRLGEHAALDALDRTLRMRAAQSVWREGSQQGPGKVESMATKLYLYMGARVPR